MIDPLGLELSNTGATSRKPDEVVSEFEGPATTLGPKVRHSNYDSPEALAKPEVLPSSTPVPESPAPVAAPAPTIKPGSPKQGSKAASTSLARPAPPKPGRFERAIGVAKAVLPLVGNLLPLLEGNVVGAASNLLANRPVKEIDLRPLEEAIARLQSDQRALAFHTSEQKSAIRRLEDEFSTLQEAVQRHAADQAELAEQVVKLAKRMSGFMRLVTILLIASILFTTLLVVRIAYILRF